MRDFTFSVVEYSMQSPAFPPIPHTYPASDMVDHYTGRKRKLTKRTLFKFYLHKITSTVCNKCEKTII